MKLVNFTFQGCSRFGFIAEDEVFAFPPELAVSAEALLAGGPEAMAAARAAADRRRDGTPLSQVGLGPPLTRPRKFLGIGFNYQSHVDEVRAKGLPIPNLENQVWFNKQLTCITGPYDPIHMPRVSDQLDYEGELGVVIGRRCRHVPPERAMSVIAGYLVCNDVSVRDWQLKAPTAMLGKGFDTHGPIGPWLTTADEIEDPEQLGLRTWVDQELRQDGDTSELIHKIPAMISMLTTAFTLEPGDILSTGSPHGVGAAFSPPRYLKVGQTVRVEIEGLGAIENRVIDEPASTTFID